MATLDNGSPAATGSPPVGARIDHDGVSYRVWAPAHAQMRVAIGGDGDDLRFVVLEKDADGFFSGRDAHGRAGDLYRFQFGETLAPDPASRFQPQGVAGPSQVIDPGGFTWQAKDWRRPPLCGRVIYELHMGTVTKEGTFRCLLDRLDALVELGVNTIELMPLADFPGQRNWGYDGVMLFAPARCYGTPDELRALVDAAHLRGLAVVLDVVYNHLGPSGNVLPTFSPYYFRDREGIWGRALNFDGEHSGPVREFFVQNAGMWLDEYRFDGLRLDAVHAVEDTSTPHFFADVAAAAHARGAFVIGEDERNDVKTIRRPDEGGWGFDAVWADDFHHTVRVALTGQRESHFGSYQGTIDEWVETLDRGWLYHGQYFPHWKRGRGTEAGHLPPERFVICISNHDQVGNRALGDRLHQTLAPERYRAVSMLLCFAPYTPMLFMGQEWAAEKPFLFFTDHTGEIGARMAKNRQAEFERYGAHPGRDALARMPDPQAEETFLASKLDWAEREQPAHAATLALYRACLQLRAEEAIFQSPPRATWSVQKIGTAVLGLRWKNRDGDWLLLLSIAPPAEWPALDDDPFVRLRSGRHWKLILGSNEPRFGGSATQPTIHADLKGLVLTSPGAALLHEV